MVLTHARRRTAVSVLLLAVAAAGVVLLFRTFDGDDPGYDYVAPWNHSAIDRSDDVLTLTYLGGSCDDHAFADVDESAERVSITVYVAERHDQDCNAAGYTRTIDVPLSAPLGNRRVVDGSGG